MYKAIVPCVASTPAEACGPHTSANGITWSRVDNSSTCRGRLASNMSDCSGSKVPTSDEQNLSVDKSAPPGSPRFLYSVKRGGKYGRAVAIATAERFDQKRWDDLGVVFQSDEEDQRLGKLEIEARLNDSSLKHPFAVPDPAVYNVDVYNMGVFKYESVYIGLPAMFHSVAPDHGNTDGFHLIKAVTSRDLRNWTWLGNRSTFIPPSRVDSGAYDLMQMLPPSNVMVKGDELYMYYTGLKMRASQLPAAWARENPDNGGICLATIRRDGKCSSPINVCPTLRSLSSCRTGFVSIVGGPGGGTVVTAPFRGPSAAQRVFVNANASVGELRVDLLAAEGYTLSTSALRGEDAARHALGLATGRGAAQAPGSPVRLRFTLAAGVHLYSYWVQ